MTYSDWTWSEQRKFMTKCVIEAYENEGYSMKKIPGRGLSNTWHVEKDGKQQKLSIRTTQDQWFAFPKSKDGWKTLDDVDLVAVASIDNIEKPQNILVYKFNADEVRNCFNASRDARLNAGMIVKDDYGMWVGLNKFSSQDFPQGVGSGLGEKYPPTSFKIPTSNLANSEENTETDFSLLSSKNSVENIVEIARKDISALIGIPKDKITLEVRLSI